MSKMNYPVWVARYSAKPAYQNPVMWQATRNGAVHGIRGNVDIDFQFQAFTSVIPANTWRTINGQTYYYQNYAKQKNNWIQDDGAWSVSYTHLWRTATASAAYRVREQNF